MTEDEAKHRWCPFVRREGDGGGAFNRGATPLNEEHHDGIYSCACIGSACMAWRTQNYIDDNRMPNVAGYCGLAGKPYQ